MKPGEIWKYAESSHTNPDWWGVRVKITRINPTPEWARGLDQHLFTGILLSVPKHAEDFGLRVGGRLNDYQTEDGRLVRVKSFGQWFKEHS